MLGALGAEGVPHLVPLIAKATPDPEDRPVQVEAVRALGRIGPEARSALPALEQVAARKGMWAKMAQRSIAAIEGKASALPEEGAGPVPPIVPEKEDAGGAETPPAPSPRPSPSPQG